MSTLSSAGERRQLPRVVKQRGKDEIKIMHQGKGLRLHAGRNTAFKAPCSAKMLGSRSWTLGSDRSGCENEFTIYYMCDLGKIYLCHASIYSFASWGLGTQSSWHHTRPSVPALPLIVL